MSRCTFTATLLLLMSVPAFAHMDRIEHVQTLTIGFSTGETATFSLTHDGVTGITLQMGSKSYAVPESECAKLHDIRFDTVAFLWNGSYQSAAKSGYFYLRFDMGTESARAFGELPQVELMFRQDKFESAKVTRKTDKNTWQASPL